MTTVDRNALRFNQASIIAGTVLAFVLGSDAGRWVLLAVALVLILGTTYAPLSGFKLIYRHLFVRAGILQPAPEPDDPAPHQFAQGMGGAFLLAAFIVLLLGSDLVAWALAFIVAALAAVNLVLGFCLGCFIYFQLGRAGLLPQQGTR